MQGWDYIIVGAGSAGCVLANRLSADRALRVLLLEAGGPDRSPYIHVPAGITRAIGNPALDWCHLAEPDPSRDGKVDLWPAGRTLGGSSSINGMLYVRGARQDFDGWAALGNRGWGYDDVLPYFRRLEDSELGDASIRGRGGPMHVSRLRTTHPLGPVFVAAAEELGIPRNPDYNGLGQEGAGEPQVTQRRGWRWSAARAYLEPAKRRPNLRIETHARVESLIVEGGRCRGVRVRRDDGTVAEFRASGEVLLAAGALGSPKILMLSGIGPPDELRRLDIPTTLALEGVGRNLQEHANSMVSANVRVRTYNVETNGWRTALHATRWLLTGRGPASSPYPHAVAFVRSRPEEPFPDLQVMFGPFAFAFDERGVVPYLKPAVTIVVNACRPVTRGRVRLRAPDPAAPIVIEHRLLSEPEDLRRQIAGCRLARRLLASRAFAPYVIDEFLPGPAVRTDAEWEQHVRRTSALGYHPVGTCAMGVDDGAVVTPELKLRGLEGLRVVDASVMPRQIAANTHAATMMIAEKTSDLLLADARRMRAA